MGTLGMGTILLGYLKRKLEILIFEETKSCVSVITVPSIYIFKVLFVSSFIYLK